MAIVVAVLGVFLREGLKKRRFFKKRHAENLQDFVQAAVEFEFLLDDGHQDVDADGDPNLRLHGVLGGAIEGFDAQVLLDPFEEKLHLPATFVEFGYRQCVQNKVVGEKDQTLARFGIDILDPPERNRIFGRCLGSSEYDGLIAAESRGFVDGTLPWQRYWRFFLARVTKKAMFS